MVVAHPCHVFLMVVAHPCYVFLMVVAHPCHILLMAVARPSHVFLMAVACRPSLRCQSPQPSFVELILIAVARLVAGRTAVVRLVRSHANIHGVAGLTAVVRRVLSYVIRSVT